MSIPPSVGLDLGKSAIDICPFLPGLSPRSLIVHHVEYEPDWSNYVQKLVPPGAVVALEPTGWHYLTPLLACLTAIGAHVWHIPTTVTGKIRAVHISSGKSDKMDARALALAASWIATGDPPRGSYAYGDAIQQAAQQLRAEVNAHYRATKAITRLSNQLDQLAFSIWPILSQKSTLYFRAASAGAITPAQLRALSARVDLAQVPGYAHGIARNSLAALVKALPDIATCPPAVETAIRDTLARRAVLEAEAAEALTHVELLVQEPPFGDITDRWLTIPGASLLTCACLHVASNGRVLVYERDEFKTACGASPKRGKSGAGDHRAHGRKPGYRPLMSQTWMWATSLLKDSAPPSSVHDTYTRLVARNHPKPFLASISQLITVCWAVARDPRGYRYPL